MSPQLAILQGDFSQSLLYKASEITSQIKDKNGFTAEQLIQIHRNNFVISVSDSLKSTFKYTLQLVGEAFFESVARQFILQKPPAVNNICVYGEQFPHYLSLLQQLTAMPYIAEMARFEWVHEQCQNLPLQENSIDLVSLQQVAPEDFAALQFSLSTSMSIFESEQNILLLRNMIMNEDVKAVDLNQPCYLLLQKQPNFSIDISELSQSQSQLIQQLQQEKTLEALHPASLQDQLSHLLTLNLISGFTVKK